MNDKKITLSIITPEKIFFSGSVYMVVIPGVEGDFGVLAEHVSLLSLIKLGIIKIYNDNDILSQQIFVSEGFAEVDHDNCTILVEKAISIDSDSKSKFTDRISEINSLILRSNEIEQNSILNDELTILNHIIETI